MSTVARPPTRSWIGAIVTAPVAGAIAGVVRESGRAEVQAIGAGAANQAIKAVAIARDYLAETGINAVCLPSFIDVVIDDEGVVRFRTTGGGPIEPAGLDDAIKKQLKAAASHAKPQD